MCVCVSVDIIHCVWEMCVHTTQQFGFGCMMCGVCFDLGGTNRATNTLTAHTRIIQIIIITKRIHALTHTHNNFGAIPLSSVTLTQTSDTQHSRDGFQQFAKGISACDACVCVFETLVISVEEMLLACILFWRVSCDPHLRCGSDNHAHAKSLYDTEATRNLGMIRKSATMVWIIYPRNATIESSIS